jgi:hypothetical protein
MLRVLIIGVALAASSAVHAYSLNVVGEQFGASQNEQQRGHVSAWESGWSSDHESKAHWQFDENSFNDALAERGQRKDNWFSKLEATGPGEIDWQARKEQWLDRLAERAAHGKYDWLHDRGALKELWRKNYGNHDRGVSAIPLPASVWLLLSGFGALLGWKKRQTVKAMA